MKAIYKIIVLVLLSSAILRAVDIGSDTAVTRFNTPPIIENGDRVAGFAWLAAGFIINSRTTTGTWDCVFPIVGTLDFNFGSLALNQDLIMNSVSSVGHWGNIFGNFHTLQLPARTSCYPDQEPTDLCTATFQSSLAQIAQVNSVAFSYDSAFIAGGLNVVAGNNLVVVQVNNESTLSAAAGTALAQIVFSVSWHPSRDWIAVGRDSAAGGTAELYNYSFTRPAGPLTLLSSVDLGGGGNDCLGVAWRPDGLFVGIARQGTPKVQVYPVNSGTGVFGAAISATNFAPNALCVDWNFDGSFLAVGTAVAGAVDELRVYSFNGVALTLNASFDVGVQVNSVAFGTSSGLQDLIAIGTSAATNNLQVYQHNSGAGTLTLISTANSIPGVNVNNVDWMPSSTSNCLAAGLPINAVGSAGELRIFGYDNGFLTQDYDREVNLNITGLRYSPNGRLLATGDSGSNISLYQNDAFFINASNVNFYNLTLKLGTNATFSSPAITFSGESTIDGNGYRLSFSPTFTLYVAANSSLLIQDTILSGISTSQFVVDTSSTVSFADVEIELDQDFTFSSGRFEVLGETEILGDGHSFIYTSTQQSIIRSADPLTTVTVASGVHVCSPGYSGSLLFSPGTTFVYNPSSGANDRIRLEGEHSEFILNSATLSVPVALALTRGSVVIDGKSTLSGSGGLTLGDGLSALNNTILMLDAAANLVVTGKLIYKNV